MKLYVSIVVILCGFFIAIQPIKANEAVRHRVDFAYNEAAAGKKPIRFKRFVVFGDSLSDSGNYFLETKTFAIRPFEAIPTEPYLIGQLHFSNGKTWIEQLAADLKTKRSAKPSFAAPGVFTNYSVGRARARFVAVQPELSDLSEQVDFFLEDFVGIAPEKRLYVLWIGVNDVRDALESLAIDPSGEEAMQILQQALSATLTNLIRLRNAGAREFLVLNMPNLAIIPAIAELGEEIGVIAEALTEDYNFALEGILQLVEQDFADVDIIRMDIFTLLNTVVDDPENFGISNATDSCITPGVIVGAICESPSQYLFWDFIHPTKKAHEILAAEAEMILVNYD